MKLKDQSIYFLFFVISAIILFLPEYVQTYLSAGPAMLSLTLISYQFVHGGLRHLLGNFIIGLAPGIYLERRLGKLRFAAFYLLCGIASALMFLLCTPIGMLCGASGSIFGILTYALLLWMREGLWQGVMSIIIFLAVFVPEILASVQFSFDGVAHLGHVGGWIGALFFAHLIKPKHKVTTRETTIN